MPLQVKLAFTKSAVGKGVLLTCKKCNYSTKHKVLFQRHQSRCGSGGGNVKTLKTSDNKFNRHYKCRECNLETTNARMYLFHLKEKHGQDFPIYLCDMCDYATKYKDKIYRHRNMIHKDAPSPEKDLLIDASKEMATAETPPAESVSPVPTETPTSEKRSRRKPAVVRRISQSANAEQNIETETGEILDRDDACEMMMMDDIDEEDEEMDEAASLTTIVTNQGTSTLQKGNTNTESEVYGYVEEVNINGAVQYKCTLCLYTHSVRYKVGRHVKQAHTNAKIYTCSLCNYQTKKRIDFFLHKAKHSNKQTYHCNLCQYSTTLRANLDRHMLNHGGNGAFKCSICNYSAQSLGRIRAHEAQYHTDAKSEDQSYEPMNVDMDDQPKLVIADEHEETMSNSAVDNSWEDVDESGLSPHAHFCCDLCGLRYKRSSDLNRHMKKKHGVRLRDYLVHKRKLEENGLEPKQSGPVNFAVKRPRLESAGGSGEQPLDLSMSSRVRHRSASGDTGLQMNLKCSHCSYMAKWPSDLRRHLKVHSIDKRYKCNFCYKRYKYQGDVNAHMRKAHNFMAGPRTQAGTYTCNICGYIAVYQSTLERHMRSHSEEKSFKCLYCYFSSSVREDLRKHLEDYHKDQLSGISVDVAMETVEQNALNERMNGPQKESTPERDDTTSREGSSSPVSLDSGVTEMHCPYCPYTARAPSKLKAHVAIHENLKAFKCPVCGQRANWKWDIQKHMRKEHPESEENVIQLTEEEARESLSTYLEGQTSRDLARASIRTDNIGGLTRPFKCSLCDRKSRWKWDISKHIRTVHPGTDAVVICLEGDNYSDIMSMETNSNNSNYGDTGSEISHDGDHHGLDLQYANQPFDMTPIKYETQSGGSSSGSLSSTPRTTPGRSTLHPVGDERPLKCSVCGRKSNWKWDLKKHIEKQHPGMDAYVIDERPPKERTPEGTPSKGKLLARNVNPRTMEDDRPYKCSKCDRRSNWNSDINRHIRLRHPNNTAHVIKLWDRSPVHVPVVASSSPTMVPLESKAGTMGVTSAANAVTDRRPFKCSLCKRRSNWKWDLSKHIRLVHAGTDAYVIDTTKEGEDPDGTENHSTTGHDLSDNGLPTMVPVRSAADSITSALTQPVFPNSLLNDNQNINTPTTVSMLTEQNVDSVDVKPKLVPTVETPRRPEFRCSGCNQQSPWITVIKRHIQAKCPNAVMIKIPYKEDARLPTPKHSQPLQVDLNQNVSSGAMNLPEKDTDDNKNAEVHILSNGDNRPYKCSMCDRRSNWKWDLNKHIRTAHPDTDATVLEMNEASEDVKKTHLNQVDINNTKRFKCGACIYRSNWRSDIVRHIRRKHHKGNVQVQVLRPDVAARTLSDYQKVAVRKLSSSSQQDEQVQIPGSPNGKPKVWKCAQCPFKDPSKELVLEHVKSHPSMEKPLKCSLCSFSSDFRSSVSRHICKHHRNIASVAIIPNPNYVGVHKDGMPEDAKPGPAQSDPDVLMGGVIEERCFRCRLCGHASNWRNAVYKHLREKHGKNDYSLCEKGNFKVLVKSCKPVPLDQIPPAQRRQLQMDPSPIAEVVQADMVSGAKDYSDTEFDDFKKKYRCTICPYSTNKQSLINLHKTHHKPSVVNKFKCRHCPYYVCAQRLLIQHLRLHVKEKSENSVKHHSNNNKALSKMKSVPFSVGDRKYKCEKCPYNTRSKHDFLYHKQFHRPKPTAPYKCKYCNYWVSRKRLLRQHMKYHEEYHQAGYQSASPAKSDSMDSSYVEYDMVDMADIKQEIIASKITSVYMNVPQDATNEKMQIDSTPQTGEPIAQNGMEGYVVNKTNYLLDSGGYRKLHKCRFCPYTNVRHNNLRMHEEMHGFREGALKCPHCDYHVGNKGLLAHHVRVHTKDYNPETYVDLAVQALDKGAGNESELLQQITNNPDLIASAGFALQKDVLTGEEILERAKFKKWCCEKCPYATTKRHQFERHLTLHGCKQRYTCDYCDYSVPGYNLLLQHKKLHLLPNQNLLAVQSISNLHHLPEVPANIAVASTFPADGSKDRLGDYIGVHDHLELHEHSDIDLEPKKLYRCDRCPYTNIRRDNLLAHLKFHMIKSELQCQYCDYSVSKTHLLNQHIKVHFNLADGYVASENTANTAANNVVDLSQSEKRKQPAFIDISELNKNGPTTEKLESAPVPIPASRESTDIRPLQIVSNGVDNSQSKDPPDTMWICQYCDRAFDSSRSLLRHEMQHLVGNKF